VEHLLYGEGEERKETNYLVAIKLGPASTGQQLQLGLAACDPALNSVHVTDFLDTEQLCQLEAMLVQVGPREVLLPQSDHALVKRVREVVERNRLLTTPRPTKDFAPLSDPETVRLLAPKASSEPIKASPLASGALNALSTYLGLGEAAGLHVEALAQGEVMRLDPRAVTGLNLLPSAARPTLPSVLSILDRTRTPGGGRLLQAWLKQPLLSVEKIQERLDLVEMLVGETEIRQACHEEHLRRFPDFQRLAGRFLAKKATLQEAYKVFVALERLEPLIGCLQTYQGDSLPALQDTCVKDLQEAQRDLENFYKMVETTLDMSEVKKGNFLVKPSFDENLEELRGQLDGLETKLQQARGRAAAELGQVIIRINIIIICVNNLICILINIIVIIIIRIPPGWP
jgi:DNA mismatch repair protein MSH2